MAFQNPYYVYALKDPRTDPVRPFYIGKGTGTRAWEHTLKVDGTRKGDRIRDISAVGANVVTAVLADDLTELQALKLEAQLIAAFGTEESGGFLTNSVIPSGMKKIARESLVIPLGVVEKAHLGVDLLKEAVQELVKANYAGITNADASKALGLQSDYGGGSKDYLTWSLLGLLMGDGKISRGENKKYQTTVR
jgi:hypothetical protein